MGTSARDALYRSSGQRRVLGLRKIKSTQNGWVIPVWLQKPESDANFERLSRILLENESIVTSAFGSHNVRSIAHAQALAEELGIDRSRFEFQLLYGMAGPIKRALVEMGYRVREYSPVGELLPGMSYLVRRLLENTSNEGFLRAKFSGARFRSPIAARSARFGKWRCRNFRHPERSRGIPQQNLEVTSEEPIGLSWTGIFARDDGTGRNGATRETLPGDTYRNASLTNFVYPESQGRMRVALRDVRAFRTEIPARDRWQRDLDRQIVAVTQSGARRIKSLGSSPRPGFQKRRTP